jgi:hypothetical protein
MRDGNPTCDIVSAAVDIIIGLPLWHDLEGFDEHHARHEQQKQHWNYDTTHTRIAIGQETAAHTQQQ